MNLEARRRWIPGLAVVVAAAFLLRRALFLGEALFWRDINMVWLPQAEVFVRTVAAGALPLWDAWTGFGRPLLADPRAEVLYPLTWLNLLLPAARFYTVFVAAHLILGGLGCYRLARALGAGRGPSTLAGVALTASGPLPALALTWHHMAGAAWMPWVLHAGLRAVRGGAGGRRALAFAVAMQVFAGSPDYSALTLLALVAVALGTAWTERGPLRPAVGRVGVGVAMGLMLAAPQWLPTAAWAIQAQRGALPREATFVWSLHPLQLVEVVAPVRLWDLPLTPQAQGLLLGSREPWLHSVHFGVGLLALALVGIVRRNAPWAAVALGAALAALGSHTPFLGLVFDLLPPLAGFRFPVKAMVLFALAAAVLAALGLERLAHDASAFRTLSRAGVSLGLALLALVAGAGSAAAWFSDPAGGITSAREALTLAALTALAVALAVRAPLSPPTRLTLVAALALLPPVHAQRHLFATTGADFFTRRPEALRALELGQGGRLYTQDQVVMPSPLAAGDTTPRLGLRGTMTTHGRVATAALGLHLALNPPTAARWGVPGSFDRDILRFEPPFLARLNDLLREHESDAAAHARLLALGAVANVASLTPGPWSSALELRARVPMPFTRPLLVWRVPAAQPRVWAVTGVQPMTADTGPAALLAADFDPALSVALDAAVRAPAGSALVESFTVTPDRLHATVVATAPAHVVFADAWDPGWSAWVDGAAAPVLRANGAFRAVSVGAGRHEVALRYWPPGLTPGLLLAAVGLLATLRLGCR